MHTSYSSLSIAETAVSATVDIPESTAYTIAGSDEEGEKGN